MCSRMRGAASWQSLWTWRDRLGRGLDGRSAPGEEGSYIVIGYKELLDHFVNVLCLQAQIGYGVMCRGLGRALKNFVISLVYKSTADAVRGCQMRRRKWLGDFHLRIELEIGGVLSSLVRIR